MIVNLLRFAFKDSTTEEEQAEVLEAMRRTASVESTAFRTVGRDLGDPAEGFTHAYCVGIPDLAALERYFYDPVHLAGDFVILPRLSRLSGIRWTDDPDPEVGKRMAELVRQKLARYPDWAQLLASIPDGRVLPTR